MDGASEVIIVLAIVGFLLMASEIFVPGMVLGLLGGVCLAVAVGVAYAHFGPVAGSLVFAGLCAFTLIGFIVWMFAFPKTVIGRRLMLRKTLPPGEGEKLRPAGAEGQEGEAITPLRPAGAARIRGRKVDVVAESDFIAVGEPVVVVRDEGMRVVVRKKV